MEPHRAPLGGEGHATEANESFHGEDTSRSRKPRSQAPPFAGQLELGSPLEGNKTTSPLLDEQNNISLTSIIQVHEYSLCYTAFGPLISKEGEAQATTQQIAKDIDSHQQTYICTQRS